MLHLYRISLSLLFVSMLPMDISAADLAREQRLAEQISDAIMDGEPIELHAGKQTFLAIHMESDAEQTKGGAIILHGRGLHPNWDTVVHPLRTALPEHGWHTLSLQMPVLDKEAKYYDYVPLFTDALPRIEAGIRFLREQGVEHIVLIAHSCGAHMAMQRIRELGEHGLAAYVGIGMGATDYRQPMRQPFPLDRMSIPVLDVYAEHDFPAVLRMAPERLALIQEGGNPQSAQQRVNGAEHYFDGYNDELIEVVSGWLNGLNL